LKDLEPERLKRENAEQAALIAKQAEKIASKDEEISNLKQQYGIQ
jgi:hypothetical protein